jgi:glycine betaine/proline transport system ATP-binding protein
VTAAGRDELLDLRRNRVSMVFQHFGLLPHRTLVDNVAFGLEVRKVDKVARRAIAERVLETVGLGGMGMSKPDQLSGGQQQRVGLARALATDPEIMLFDEPFSALDPLIRRDMQDEVRRLHAEVAKTMVFITHDLAEALRLGDRIAIMRDGRFVQIGTPEEVVANPADDYVRNFVRDVPRSHVISVSAIMTPGAPDAYVTSVLGDTKVRDIVGQVAMSELPVRVVDASGTPVGSVSRLAVLEVIAGDDLHEIRAVSAV